MNTAVQQYIEHQPSPQREILEKIRALIKETAPLADEAMNYGVPAFKWHGNLIM